ncbi:CENP-A multicopy suppressor protein 2 [Madurella fahalii]|uniref:CENP-A multicopy suppressor protein 2 n=1 Tax=Madurella fahalii TaxID=1157608 RepID=A0ABQ0G997_9PEZI
MATPTNTWSAPSPHPPTQPTGGEEPGFQVKPMGLKVHYTFDRDGQVHCLARWPHILEIQTIPLDERTTIGVVDLLTCLQAVAQCSPEIVNQEQSDYSVYAYDYSEPDVPLVGQGMLSWGLHGEGQQQQLVTGRVTRNLLAILSNGSKDTLEVKLKMTAVERVVQRTIFPSSEGMNGTKSAPTPADAATEWNSLIQSNPMLAQSSNAASVRSPALAPAQLNQFNPSMVENRPTDTRSDSVSQPPIRPASIPPANVLAPVAIPPANNAPSAAPVPKPQHSAENAPSPAAPPATEFAPQPRPSRPSSRSRSKKPTGRPRGRPRKTPLETGNTSAAEEATDGDEGPQKKRAKVTRTEYSAIAPFGSVPDSLRVAASTSGSLRTMRPVGAGGDATSTNHLQDVPRAPTPIPDAPLLQQQQQRRRAMESKARSESVASMESVPPYHSIPGRTAVQSLSQDARSPAESIAQTPDQGYSPEDSAGELGSSPPVPRTTAYIQSSPPASSPVLPAMSVSHVDSGFMSGGLEDFYDDEDMLQLSQAQMQDQAAPVAPLPLPNKQNAQKNGRAQQQQQQQQQRSNFPFQAVNPGPPELLPTKSIFNPAGKAKTLNRPTAAPSAPPAAKKPAVRSLKRSNTAPNPVVSDQEPLPQEQLTTQQNGNGLPHCPTETYGLQEQASFPNGPVDPTPPPVDDADNGFIDTSQQEPASTTASAVPLPEPLEPTGIQEPTMCLPTQTQSRPASRGPPGPPVPASDPVAEPVLTLPRAFMSEAPCPSSDFDPPRYNKNMVKKQSIKERLENAIQKGESPPFCGNCGAIETPTWRKIWTQDHYGVPGFHEFSEKPGCVTAIDVLERDSEGQPSMYRLVKKTLGAQDDKKLWKETLLCNPCGIWLGKFKVHRPPERWEKDFARLNQPRKKREPKSGNSKSKKARTKSDAQANPISEAYLTTDPIGPVDNDSPKENYENGMQSRQRSVEDQILNLRSSPKQRLPGSTHSRGSGTADSPIAVEDDLGSTRRLLFPSPRKDRVPKVLGELSLNMLQTATNAHQETKSATAGKENKGRSSHPGRPGTPVPDENDELAQELFGTPPRCPSTPPPKPTAGPFKTPTRPTPSHRPITRSISRSIRSIRTMPKSPGQMFATVTGHSFQRTPSKTPRSSTGNSSSSIGRRRSPRHQQHLHPHFALDIDDAMHGMQFDSPFTATLNQLLSEANEFTAGSPSHGLKDLDHLDLSSLPPLAGGQNDDDCSNSGNRDGNGANHHHQHLMDFGSFLSTDLVMPSSPPLLRSQGGGGNLSVDFGGSLGDGGEEPLWGLQQQQQQQQVK